MSRSFVLGNQNMLITLDNQGQVRDCYFPYVGMENHTSGHPDKIGIWADGNFSWYDSPEWKKISTYEDEALTTDIIGTNKKQGLEIGFNDIVDFEKNIFLRKVTVKNKLNKKRDIRLFFHQTFTILESPFEDTVFYNPLLKSIIHYKSERYFLINACFAGVHESGIYSYSCGNKGTYKQAETGVLDGTAIKHGYVDSTLSINFSLDPDAEQVICYWICIGNNIDEVKKLNSQVLKDQYIITYNTKKESKKWVNRTNLEFRGLSDQIVRLYKRSLLVARAHVDRSGSIIASSDSKIIHDTGNSYSHVWPRDGSIISLAFDRGGYKSITQNFFRFCADVITKDGYLFQKYLPNKTLASNWISWFNQEYIQLPIQEDETANVLYALWRHYNIYKDKDFIKEMYEQFIKKAGNFLINFINPDTGLIKQSYDLWEEKLGIHTYTCCTVYAGLQASAFFEDLLGNKSRSKEYEKAADKLKDAILLYLYDDKEQRFIKGLYINMKTKKLEKDMTNDMSNFYGIFEFNVLDGEDPKVKSTFEAAQRELHCSDLIGGYARHEHDTYYQINKNLPGNPWFITTLWAAEYYICKAKNQEDLKPAIDIFEWVTKYALPTGILSEQIDPETGEQLSAAPLTWSHAAYVAAVIKYLEKLDELGICPICEPVTGEEIDK